LRTIDAHVGGQAVRLVVEGFPTVEGAEMLEKRAWIAEHHDSIRCQLLFEPRGHADMTGALFTEAVDTGAHAGLIFMDGDGYPPVSVHGVIGATMIAYERGLLLFHDKEPRVVYDTPAGTVAARLTRTQAGERLVTVTNVASYVVEPAVRVAVGSRSMLADLAYGGRLYAIVDSESAGVGMTAAHVPELRRMGTQIIQVLESSRQPATMTDGYLGEVAGTVFTGPASDEHADLRIALVTTGGRLDRSASGTGMSAVMAVLHAMGVLGDDHPLVAESLIGTRISGRVSGRTTAGDRDALVIDLQAAAWITGEHSWLVDPQDPLGDGFRF
jgi:proline racemase